MSDLTKHVLFEFNRKSGKIQRTLTALGMALHEYLDPEEVEE